jgi:hypothetical protein
MSKMIAFLASVIIVIFLKLSSMLHDKGSRMVAIPTELSSQALCEK